MLALAISLTGALPRTPPPRGSRGIVAVTSNRCFFHDAPEPWQANASHGKASSDSGNRKSNGRDIQGQGYLPFEFGNLKNDMRVNVLELKEVKDVKILHCKKMATVSAAGLPSCTRFCRYCASGDKVVSHSSLPQQTDLMFINLWRRSISSFETTCISNWADLALIPRKSRSSIVTLKKNEVNGGVLPSLMVKPKLQFWPRCPRTLASQGATPWLKFSWRPLDSWVQV